jgi:ribosome production factor 2
MGPRLDLTLGREQFPDADMLKEALKKPKTSDPKTKKNIDTDAMGDKVGKIHPGKQDFNTLQSRKMKGLKRSRDAEVEDAPTTVEAADESDEETTPKKARV